MTHSTVIPLTSILFSLTPKAPEGIIPNEPEEYRPPAELYTYLTNMGEIYEGEKTQPNCLK